MELLILLPLCLLSWRGALGQSDASGPYVVEVNYGNTARIPCILPSSGPSKLTLHWLFGKTEQKIYSRGPNGSSVADSELKNRVTVEDDFTLVINRTSVQDENVYICREESETTGPVDIHVQLRVFKAPEQPEMKLNEEILVNDESTKIGSCESKNGFPVPNITWYKNDSPLMQQQDTSFPGVTVAARLTQESSGLFTVLSTLSMPVQASDNTAVFYCEVSYQLLGKNYMIESKRGSFTTLYPNTKLTLIMSPPGPVKEGDTVELICQGDGNPQPETTFFWGSDSFKDGISSLILRNVTRENSGGYRCTGLDFNNIEHDLEAKTEIYVHFLDTPQISVESPLVMNVGGNVNIMCNANGSSEMEFQWKHDDKIIADGQSLELKAVNYDMSGRYTCVVSLPIVPDLSVSKELQILVKGEPDVSVSPKKVLVQNNDLVKVMCKAQGYPLPNIIWLINGTVKNINEEYGVSSELTLLITPELINMTITCEASNSIGTNSDEVQLEEGPVTIGSSTTTTTSLVNTETPVNTTEESIIKEHTRAGKHGVVIVAVIVCILLLAILGAVLYFLYKKGRIPCGRSGKQDITSPGEKDQIVVEMKPDSPAEESVLLPESQEKKPPGDQGEKYMDLRN